MKDTSALAAAFAISFVAFIGAPNIPNWVLKMFVNTYVGVILLLVAVVVALKVNPLLSLAAFLAAGAFFLENRKRILIKIEQPEVSNAVAKGAPVSTLAEGSPDVTDGEVHPEHEEPTRDDHSFAPEKDASDEFHPVGESIDAKVPPPEGSSAHAVADHYTRSNGIPS